MRTQVRERERQAEEQTAAHRGGLCEMVHRRHRQRGAERHQQLDMRDVREHVGTEAIDQAGNRRAKPAALSTRRKGGERRGRKRDQHHRVERSVGVLRSHPDRRSYHARDDVGFEVRERSAMGIEDVCVEEGSRMRRERVSHPGHVPYAVTGIAAVDSSCGSSRAAVGRLSRSTARNMAATEAT